MFRESTREAIINQAKQLFNERGYFNVSMRDIADKLGISPGNLTYYFKKKEDLIEAVLLDQHNSRASFLPPTNTAGLAEFIENRVAEMRADYVYFLYHAQLADTFEKFREIQVKTATKFKQMLDSSLDILVQNGEVKPFASKELKDGFISAFVSTCYFLPPLSVRLGADDYPNEVRNALFGITIPLLTDKGLKVMEESESNSTMN